MTISPRWRLLGERRALSLLVLGFYTTMFVVIALAQGGAWARCFGALALTYGLAFFSVAAEWFWGRWFAMGIATSGMTMAALGLLTNGWSGGLALWGVLHAAVYLPLIGPDMARRYDGQAAWRQRYELDEAAVDRIKRSVKGAAAALPTLILYTLAPRQGGELVALSLLAIALVGLGGVLRLRTWGVLLLAGSGLALLPLHLIYFTGGLASVGALTIGLAPFGVALSAVGLAPWISGTVATIALAVAASPFVLPIWRSLHPRSTYLGTSP